MNLKPPFKEPAKPEMENCDPCIRVALVEDDRFVRERLSEDIASATGLQVVKTCSSVAEALIVLPESRPHVVLMDIGLPEITGIEGVRRLKVIAPSVQILMVTVYEDSQRIFDALLAGAGGYLLKRTPRDELIEAIRQIYAGGAPMSGHIARKVVQHFNRIGEHSREVDRLSRREREVLERLAQGAAYKEIAEMLQLSIETIRMNVKSIYTKLHVHSRGEAVAKYFRR